jgi:NTP pyrophosphatase (non-canonical NTP hydrolase)
MTDKEVKEILQKAINTFGANQQIIKAMEELGELNTALARYFNTDKIDLNNIYEEIADVEIMCNQLRLIFDNYVIDHYREMKLNRLKGVVW